MPAFNRANMPEEFYDRTSDMLLIQPEPQYPYALMFLSALGLSLVPPNEVGVAQRTIGGVGANYTAADQDRLMLTNPVMNQVIAAAVDFNAAPGGTIKINRPVYANTTYTQAARIIPSGGSISVVPIVPTSQQNNLTLFRYGGPYDSANSRVAPFAIEGFDANMGVHKAANIIGTHLVRDCHRFLDAVQVVLLDLASTTAYPAGMTADNDATSAGSFTFTFEQLNRTGRKMDDANLPTFPDGFRMLMLTPTQVEQLALDPMYQRSAKEFSEYNILFPSYVKSVSKFHIFKSTTLSAPLNSSSVAIQYGHAIAPGALLAGMGRSLRVAASTDDNYGETVKVIWLGDLAFGLANRELVVSVRSSA